MSESYKVITKVSGFKNYVATSLCYIQWRGVVKISGYTLGFNSRKGGILGSREILLMENSRKIFIFPGNSRYIILKT